MNTQEFIDKWTDRPGEREVMARDIEALLAALTAERDGLAMQVKDLEELRDYLRNALQDEAGIQKNQREANALLARERKKAEAALKPFADLWRESLADKPDDTLTYGFNDVVITVGQIREARRVVDNLTT